MSRTVNIELLIPIARKLLLDAFELPDSTPQPLVYDRLRNYLSAARARNSPVERRPAGIVQLSSSAHRKIKGAEKAYSDIVEAYQPYIKRLVQSRYGRIAHKLPWLTYEDLCQEASAEFYTALMQFDMERKPPKHYFVLTYCTFKIRSRINALINHERKTPATVDTTMLLITHEEHEDSNLDRLSNIPSGEPDQLESMVLVERRAELDTFIDTTDKYTAVQKDKLRALLDGRTTGEVAALFNCARESVRLLQTSLVAWFRIFEELNHV